MSEELKYKLYNPGDCIPEQTMFDYIDNKLSPKEQHMVEKHLIDCDLCADALEGLKLLKNRKRIADLNLAVRERIAAPEKKTVILNMRIVISAAAAVILFIGGIYFFQNFTASEKEDLAELKEAPSASVVQNDASAPEVSDSNRQNIPLEESVNKNLSKEKIGLTDVEQSQKSAENEVSTGSGIASTVTTEELAVDDDKKNIPDIQNKGFSNVGAASNSTNTSGVISNNNNNNSISYQWSAPVAPDEKSKSKDAKAEQENKKTEDSSKGENDNENKDALLKEQVAKRDENRSTKPEKKKEAEKTEEKAAAPVTYTVDLADQSEGIAGNDKALADSSISLSSAMNQTYSVVDEMPQFPGGEAEMMKYIQKNLKYPSLEKDTNVSGTIYIQFVVDKTGTIKNPKIFKGISPSLDEEALRVVRSMPKWKPGKLKGSAVDVLYTLPFKVLLR
jgi:periplasmic protein TonB